MKLYDQGWSAVNRLLRAGSSFSGRERNCCFLNIGQKRFANVSSATGLDLIHDGRGFAMVDWDFDGDLDFWITSRTGPRVRFVDNSGRHNNGFLAIRLQGVTSNRDAIGARVEVHLDSSSGKAPMIKTLYAGHGYLSQSSKWMHFGLGNTKQVDRIVVHWPGEKQPEVFRQAEVNGRYKLIQGTGQANRWEPPRLKLVLAPTIPKAPKATDEGRVILLKPATPLPIYYYDSSGKKRSLDNHLGQPLLLNLWSTTCAPCLAEMQLWAKNDRQFKDANLRILALCADSPADNQADDLAKIMAVKKQLDLPYEVGLTDDQTVITCDVLQRTFIGRQRPMPVPTSFLFDRDGKLAAIYRGTVDSEQLMADVKLLGQSPETIIAGAIPFRGKWLSRPTPTEESSTATMLTDLGRYDDARDFCLLLIAKYERELPKLEGAAVKKLQRKIAGRYELIGRIALDRNRLNEAVEVFQEVVRVFPNHREAHLKLAEAFRLLKKPDQQIEQLESVLKIKRDDPQRLLELALLQMNAGQFDVAEKLFRESLAMKESARARYSLARTLLAKNQAKLAIGQFEIALKVNPNGLFAANDLAWVLAANHDEKLRDGDQAVSLAEMVVKKNNWKHRTFIGTLAVAYAEAGRFDDAVKTVEKAIKIAEKADDKKSLSLLKSWLKLFEAKQAYHESPKQP